MTQDFEPKNKIVVTTKHVDIVTTTPNEYCFFGGPNIVEFADFKWGGKLYSSTCSWPHYGGRLAPIYWEWLGKWHFINISNSTIYPGSIMCGWRLAEIPELDVQFIRKCFGGVHCNDVNMAVANKYIGSQLLTRGVGLISSDENEPSCDNSQTNRGDASNGNSIVIKGFADLNKQERKEAICGAIFVFGCLIIFAYFAIII